MHDSLPSRRIRYVDASIAFIPRAYESTLTLQETIGDIEDLCSLCEPLPSPFAVTALPMKAEKKKAREEVDIVSVVEWKSTAESEDRWFLLVRRPEKGKHLVRGDGLALYL